MWTHTSRAQYARAELALPSDLTDAEWALLEPFLPSPSHVGRPRKWPLRRIVEAIVVKPAVRRLPPQDERRSGFVVGLQALQRRLLRRS